jgi:hypothetical protein
MAWVTASITAALRSNFGRLEMPSIKNSGAPDLRIDSARHYVLITPDNDDDLPGGPCRGLLVGTAGTANLVQEDGTERANVPLVAGYNHLVVRRVKTGGNAANLWALY